MDVLIGNQKDIRPGSHLSLIPIIILYYYYPILFDTYEYGDFNFTAPFAILFLLTFNNNPHKF